MGSWEVKKLGSWGMRNEGLTFSRFRWQLIPALAIIGGSTGFLILTGLHFSDFIIDIIILTAILGILAISTYVARALWKNKWYWYGISVLGFIGLSFISIRVLITVVGIDTYVGAAFSGVLTFIAIGLFCSKLLFRLGNTLLIPLWVISLGLVVVTCIILQRFSVYDTPDWANDVYVSGSTAYVADGKSGLQIIDVSNPSSPKLLGSYDTPDRAEGVYVSGNTAYVADWESGLQIIDASNPSSPKLLGSYDTPDWAEEVYVSGNTAYVADGKSGLQIIDVSNPSSPKLLGSYDTPGCADAVYVSYQTTGGQAGATAYVADRKGGLQIIDVSNPEAPRLLGSYNTSASAVYVSHQTTGGQAGMTAYTVWAGILGGGLRIINVSDPTNPTLLGSYRTSGYAQDVYVSGTTAYVADRKGGLQILDVSNPSSPTLLGSYVTPGKADGVYVSGTTAYVADGRRGLRILDVSGYEGKR